MSDHWRYFVLAYLIAIAGMMICAGIQEYLEWRKGQK